MKHGTLSIGQRRGILSLIPQKDVDMRMLKSITGGYRCNSVHIPKWYIKGRYIGENIRTIADLVDISKSKNTMGFIALLIDFEKAFDTVKRSFLFQSL